MLDAQDLSEQFKLMSIIGCFLSEDLVGKFLAIVGQHFAVKRQGIIPVDISGQSIFRSLLRWAVPAL